MTCREKLKLEHPEYIRNDCYGGCQGCPTQYGYLDWPSICGVTEQSCIDCWDREIPETEPLTYKHEGEPIGKVSELTTNDNGVKAKVVISKKTMAEIENVVDTAKKAIYNNERYKQFEDAADETYSLYRAYVNAGFFEDQAFELTKIMLKGKLRGAQDD